MNKYLKLSDCELIAFFSLFQGIRALSKVMKKSGKTFYFCCMKENIESVLQGADSTPFVTYSTIQDAEQKLRTSC